MKEVLVSVRMPSSMIHGLRGKADRHHFLDVSEAVRSIVRKNWMRHASPELFELRQLRNQIGTALLEKSRKRLQQEINRELASIRDSLKRGEAVR